MKKLTRNREDKWLGGVCGGLATYTGVDATMIRLAVVVCTILGAGSLVIAYVVAWVLIPAQAPVPRQTVWPQAPDAPTTGNEPRPPSA